MIDRLRQNSGEIYREVMIMERCHTQLLQGGVDPIRAMRLLMQQKEELLQSGYDEKQIYALPGILILKLDDGQVCWMLDEGTFKMEVWKDSPTPV
ncbi:hypothetical protein M3212_09635 [Alkalihalobacillus oceani]|uniref:hypothetical protein n=1 Tax=Halalkalibacter oceani TaxID=1653776 RepID=UPI002041C63D|nr:hypothetical protein [Halalkalibacter oceani]MCM3761045.1 hypothetical protein [Halalkalibacter oceani]